MCEELDTFFGILKTYMYARARRAISSSPLYGYTFRSSLSSLSFTQPFTLIFHRHTIPAKFRSPKPMCFTSRRLRCNKSAIRIFYSAIRKNKSRTCCRHSVNTIVLRRNRQMKRQNQGRPEPRLRPCTSSLKPLATSMMNPIKPTMRRIMNNQAKMLNNNSMV